MTNLTKQEINLMAIDKYDIVYNGHFNGGGIGKVDNGKCMTCSDHEQAMAAILEENNLLKGQVVENDARIARLELAQPCPCGDVGFFVIANRYTGEPEQEQCEFCYTEKDSRFNVLNESPLIPLANIKADAIDEMLRKFEILDGQWCEMKGDYFHDYANELRKVTQ